MFIWPQTELMIIPLERSGNRATLRNIDTTILTDHYGFEGFESSHSECAYRNWILTEYYSLKISPQPPQLIHPFMEILNIDKKTCGFVLDVKQLLTLEDLVSMFKISVKEYKQALHIVN